MSKENLQRACGRIFLLPLGAIIIALLRFRGKYSISNIDEVRKRFKELADTKRPLVICPNHLTLIDSVLLHWAFAPLYWYFINYRFFSWNLPAVENVNSKFSWKVITFLTKCMLLNRSGDSQYLNRMLDKVKSYLCRGDLVTIFPEGTRSRTGYIDEDKATYGIGKILQGLPECNVICVYLRGRGQKTYSDFPQKGEIFDICIEKINPQSAYKGLRAAKDISLQVITKLKEMENRYFEARKLCSAEQ